MVERCVLALTDENDIVYDPFVGVGSSIIAALKNNRKGYGTELIEDYIQIGKERIEKLASDILKTRPIYQRIYEPTGNDKVSKYPKEWLETRLEDLSVLEKQIKAEMTSIKKDIKEREKSE